MNRVWIVTKFDMDSGQLLNIFREDVREKEIKNYIRDNYWRKDNTYGEPAWKGLKLELNRFETIEVVLVEFTEIEN